MGAGLILTDKESDSSGIDLMTESGSCEIGDVLYGGWVVAGKSPENGLVFSVSPSPSENLEMHTHGLTWVEADQYASSLNRAYKDEIRLPSIGELNAIFNNLIVTGMNDKLKLRMDGSAYWSSTSYINLHYHAYIFNKAATSDFGYQENNHHFRCIRYHKDLSLRGNEP